MPDEIQGARIIDVSEEVAWCGVKCYDYLKTVFWETKRTEPGNLVKYFKEVVSHGSLQ